MHIGVAGPTSWNALRPWLPEGRDLPPVFTFPLIGRLAAGLRQQGHTITIFTTSTALSSPAVVEGKAVRVFIAPMRAKRSAYDFYRKERRLLEGAMCASGCDILHAHWCYEFAAAALDSGRPTLVTAHDNPNEEHHFTRWTRAFPYWWFRCFFGRQIVRRAPFLSAVSPYVENNLRQISGPGARIRVIPNGVTPELFQRGQDRLAKPIRTECFTVTSVLEGFGKRKNAQKALEAFAEFRLRHPKSRYVMFGGDYQEGGSAHSWARHWGFDTGVDFRGHTPQSVFFPFLGEQTDLLLHPALLESHPMAITEAMALGVPVLGGRASGGVSWTLDEGRAGALTDVRDPGLMANALEDLANHPEKRAHLARAGWEHARRFFREETMVASYLQAYQEVLAKTSRAAMPSTAGRG